MDQQEDGRARRAVTALVAGWLGVLVGCAGLIVAGAAVGMLVFGRGVELDYTAAGIIGGLGVLYLLGAVLLLRRRLLGRRILVGVSGAMSAATLLVVVLNGAGHGWRLGVLDWWLGLNLVILVLSLIEPTRRWTVTR
ncbi:hypothetical protein [Nocardia sp. AG03]|uniref:hypothetical protein n=1 Tax=Nocardia sp. AG03 TaxID=3025312 RepID=UPI002418803A|nr:hypothetical protein [Nocardia sp. AG03]